MAAEDNKINICNKALIAIGADEITSFNDGTVEAKVAAAKYDVARKDLLAMYFWTFNQTESYLARLAGDNLCVYKYLYALPDGYLRAVNVRENGRFVDYTFRDSNINTDASQPILTYMTDCSEERMPPYFVSLLIDRLARDFLIPITGKNDDYMLFDRIYQDNFARAKSADAQSKTPRKVDSSLLLRIR